MTAEARPFDAADAEAFLLASADAREALEIPRGATLAVAPLARGEYHVNFVFAHPLTRARFVFRVNLGSQMHLDHQIRYEASALRLLARSGRTPGVLHVDDSGTFFGHGVLVEEFLPGRPLDYRCDLDEAARVLADIHSVVVPAEHGLVEPTNPLAAIASECAELFSAYRAWEGADANVVARIGGMLAAAEDLVRCEGARPSASGCHVINTELNARNFLIDRASARARGALIDWEKPIVGPVEQDLAHFLVPTTTFWATDVLLDAAEQRRFVEAYIAAVGDRFSCDGIEARLGAYAAVTCMRGLTWCAMAYAADERGERAPADAYTRGKIRAYLADDLLGFVERAYFGA